MDKYGEMFMAMNRNIDLKFIPLPPRDGDPTLFRQQVIDLIQEEQPDLIYVPNYDVFSGLIEQGQLYELQGLISRDSKNQYHTGVIERIKQFGDDKLYGLSSTFRRKGLFYNPSLFVENNVLPPSDKMTWDQLLSIAEQFNGITNKNGDPIAGLAIYDHAHVFSILAEICATEQLYLLGENNILFDTSEWSSLFSRFVDGVMNGYIYIVTSDPTDTLEDLNEKMKFHRNNAAMALGYDGMINSFEDHLKWEVVSEPVNAENPDLAYTLNINELFSINKQSNAIAATWELLKLMNSDKNTYDRNYFELTSFMEMTEWNGVNVEPFYDFTGVLLPPQEHAPAGFFAAFDIMARQVTDQVLDGSISIEEAIVRIQQQGDLLYASEIIE